VQITHKIEPYTTNSGKQAITWECTDCHHRFSELGAYFYQSILKKDNIEESLTIFTNAINDKTVAKLFKKPSTANKLYMDMCHCTTGVVDIEYLRGVKRAKDILARGMSQYK